ncbi:MAG: PDZ domain-containing protein [Verrucomicrobiota bacterium]
MNTRMNTLIRLPIAVAAVLLAGCASHHPKEKPVHEQGWIGGRYKCAKPRATVANWLFGGDHLIYYYPPGLEESQKSGIFATELGTNTPAYRAGLRAGDLILELDHRPVTDLMSFRSAICAARPGASLPVKAWRDGQTEEYEIIVGRETFRHRGTLMVGLGLPIPGFWDPPHLVPTREAPSVSLVAAGWEQNDKTPVDFNSVEQRYRHSCNPKDKPQGDDEEWRCWLAIFQVSKGKTILGQEPVAAK